MSDPSRPAAVPTRGGRGLGRGGRGGSRSSRTKPVADGNTSAAGIDNELQEKLKILRELLPDWSDEDLASALKEAGGDADLAYNLILEGKCFLCRLCMFHECIHGIDF